MKNNDEMYQSLLSRYEEYQQKKKKRLLVIGRVVPALACFCLAVILGLGYWNHNSGLPIIPEHPEIIEATTVSTAEITQSAQTTTDIKKVSATSTTKTTATTVSGHSTAVTTDVSETRQTAITEQTTAGNTETQATAATVQSTSTQLITDPIITTVTTAEQLKVTVPKVLWGYPDEETGHQSAARTSQNIVMKCDAFCAEGETLTVEAAMGDVGLRPYNYDTAGDYEYDVYVCNLLNYKDMEDERFIVNGERKGYRKEFSREELKLLDINGRIDDYDAYHQEITTIDFSDYEAGSSGSIAFKLLEVFDDNSYMGGIQYMYFYKGEIGTSISNISIEDAMNNYQTVTMT